MTDLSELLIRARQATGQDMELDARVWCYLNGKKFIGAFPRYGGGGTQAEYTEPPKRTRLVTRDGDVIEASRSIDAALALVERCLPGWQVNLSTYGSFAEASVGATGAYPRHRSATPALAILSALLRALGEKP